MNIHNNKLLNIESLITEYNLGTSLTKLEIKYRISRKVLSRLFRERSVNIRQDNKIHIYNETYFNEIDTEEKAYWLGFLYADGWVSRDSHQFSLCLKSSDILHLVKFRDIITPTGKIMQKNVKLGDKIFSAHTFGGCNGPLRNTLVAKGCTPRKSLTLQFPNSQIVPNNLRKHFIRGYFDGDGSVSRNCKIGGLFAIIASFTGTRDFLDSLQNVLIEEIPNYTIVSVRKDSRSKCFFISKGGKNAPMALLKYLYDGCSVCLERKRDKYLSAFAVLSSNA